MKCNKFRAWVNHSFKHGFVYFNAESGLYGFTNPVIEQCLEINDKNGKEIYEGDIVKFFTGYMNEDMGVDFIEEDSSPKEIKMDIVGGLIGNLFGLDISNPFELEIIGNIHENPELLTEVAESSIRQ